MCTVIEGYSFYDIVLIIVVSIIPIPPCAMLSMIPVVSILQSQAVQASFCFSTAHTTLLN